MPNVGPHHGSHTELVNSQARQLSQLEAGFAWGLLWIRDADARTTPEFDFNRSRVAADRSVVMVQVAHEQEGPVEVVVWDSIPALPRKVIWQGHLQVPSGTLVVTDTQGTISLNVSLAEPVCELAILVEPDDTFPASRVDVVVVRGQLSEL